jgi:iron(III) transport system ATP-binding protein
MSFLKLTGLEKHYGPVAALGGVDLAVKAGSRTAIVGPSGSGKTTLLRIIAGFDLPDAGTVTLDGRALADGRTAMPAYQRGIGVVAQDGALFPHLTVAANIGFGLSSRDATRHKRIAELLEMVGLETGMLRRKPDELSGGQQQRVALARALARKPTLMLLDEPFSALDTGLRATTRKAVAELLAAEGVTTILVTHDQAEALSFADQVAVMRDGLLSQVGTPRDLYLRPNNPMIAEFLGEAVILTADVADGIADCALGRIAVDDRERKGRVRIMLRPEQISLMAGPAHGQSTGGPLAEVVEIDFGGAACTVSLRLPGLCDAATHRLSLRQPSTDLPEIGAQMRIVISGKAHIFAD